jgi:SagB-type dehydrogenase family enzyme
MGTSKSLIYLPEPVRKGVVSLEEAINRRRSVRDFQGQPLTLNQLSQLLWAAQGITNRREQYRTAASAGATYPLELVVACDQDGAGEIEAGIYHYNITEHSLTRYHSGDIRQALADASSSQDFIRQVPLNIIISALYERTIGKYGTRGVRYVHMEAGHVSQNIYLQAAALGLATVAIGAFQDERVREALRLETEIRPLYIMPVGKATGS